MNSMLPRRASREAVSFTHKRASREAFVSHVHTSSCNHRNDLAEFYGNEDFMEIFCVLPFMVDFMMRSGTFDDNGHVHTCVAARISLYRRSTLIK